MDRSAALVWGCVLVGVLLAASPFLFWQSTAATYEYTVREDTEGVGAETPTPDSYTPANDDAGTISTEADDGAGRPNATTTTDRAGGGPDRTVPPKQFDDLSPEVQELFLRALEADDGTAEYHGDDGPGDIEYATDHGGGTYLVEYRGERYLFTARAPGAWSGIGFLFTVPAVLLAGLLSVVIALYCGARDVSARRLVPLLIADFLALGVGLWAAWLFNRSSGLLLAIGALGVALWTGFSVWNPLDLEAKGSSPWD